MKKLNFSAQDIALMEVMHKGENSIIVDNTEELIKVFTFLGAPEEYRAELLNITERKVLLASKYTDFSDDIAIPTGLVYVDDKFAGHSMTRKKGKSFKLYFNKGII